MPLGYIEAKDIGESLDKTEKLDQLARYKGSLGNLILTDYLEFHWFVQGEKCMTARLGTPASKGKITVDEAGLGAVLQLLDAFLQSHTPTLRNPKDLASRMAAIALLIRATIRRAYESGDGEGTLHVQMKGFQVVLLHDPDAPQFADMYAQTICYGLFAARCAQGDLHDFTRMLAPHLLAETNFSLRKRFNHIAGVDLDDRIVWAVDELAELLNRASPLFPKPFGSWPRWMKPSRPAAVGLCKKAKKSKSRLDNAGAMAESELLLHQTEDGQTRVQVRLVGETVWLTQKKLGESFQKDVRTVSEHIHPIFEEGELREEAVLREFQITAADAKSYEAAVYNLDVIISVGYRVRSHRGTQFRIWATQRLREFIVKGFTLGDQRLKDGGWTDTYFDELLERVREIRTSERLFYKKVCEIYATSVDYSPDHPMTQGFFATVQNKFHYTIHGHTAAELIVERADPAKPHMGLTHFKGARVRKAEVTVAKNYLAKEEADHLNLIVEQYLSFAELQARQRKATTMQDWIEKLHGFLRLNDRSILTDAGRVSHDMAEELTHAADKRFDDHRKVAELDDSEFDRQMKRIGALGTNRTWEARGVAASWRKPLAGSRLRRPFNHSLVRHPSASVA